MKNGKIQTFTDLNVWKEGHKLVIIVDQLLQGFIRKSKTFIIHKSSSINQNKL